MARKPATRVEFTLFDVVYEDGSLRSNRRVPSDVLGGLDGDAAARAVIEEVRDSGRWREKHSPVGQQGYRSDHTTVPT